MAYSNNTKLDETRLIACFISTRFCIIARYPTKTSKKTGKTPVFYIKYSLSVGMFSLNTH